MFFGNIIFIAMGEINELWKIHNNLEKAEVLFFIKMDVDFQQIIWLTHGDQSNIAKSHQKLLIFICIKNGPIQIQSDTKNIFQTPCKFS